MLIIMKRSGMQFSLMMEWFFDWLGWHRLTSFTRALAKTFSRINSQQTAQLASFISVRMEIERQAQRHQYFVDKKAAVEQKLGESDVHSLDEEEKWLWEIADTELEVLPYRVYKTILSLEDYRNLFPGGNQWSMNVWIREYRSLYKGRHRDFDRRACARRLGCCAASCGCCDRPRQCQGGPFMRMVREKYLGKFAHCSVDCGCCIQRRGFDMSEEEVKQP